MNTASKRTFVTVKTFTLQSGKNDIDGLSRSAAYDNQQQLRQGQDNRGIDSFRPTGAKSGDITSRLGPNGTIAIAIADGAGNWREVLIPMNLIGNDAIASPTGGGTVDTECRAAVASILSLLRTLFVLDT